MDSSYKWAAHVAERGLGRSLFDVMNEYGQVCSLSMLQDESSASMKVILLCFLIVFYFYINPLFLIYIIIQVPLLSLSKNIKNLNNKASICFLDDCCKHSNVVNDVFDFQNTTTHMQKLEIISSDTLQFFPVSIDNTKKILDPLIEILEKKHVVIGLDIETTNKKVDDSPEYTQVVNVISLAFTIDKITTILVIRPKIVRLPGHPMNNKRYTDFNSFIKSGVCTMADMDLLLTILRHRNSIFTGRGVLAFDFKWLHKCFGNSLNDIPQEKFIELSHLAKQAGFQLGNRNGLDLILKLSANRYLDKSVRTTNWEQQNLTKEQEQYAGADAWASLICYHKLQQKIKNRNLLGVSSAATIHSPALEEEDDSSEDDSAHREQAHSFQTNESLPHQRCLGDVLHFIKRITDLVPSTHPMQSVLCKALSEVIFKANEQDLDKVIKVLEKKGLQFKDVKISNPSYFQQRIRKVIPSPDILASALNILLQEFRKKDYYDTSSAKAVAMKKKDPHFVGFPLLSEEAVEAFERVIVHARKGCISDPKGVHLYFHVLNKDGSFKVDADGLYLWRCVRGTNKNETFHRQLEMYWEPWNVSPKYAYLTLLSFTYRYNVRAAWRNRPNYPYVGHYCLYLINEINCITVRRVSSPTVSVCPHFFLIHV
jgi:hypothetical protein